MNYIQLNVNQNEIIYVSVFFYYENEIKIVVKIALQGQWILLNIDLDITLASLTSDILFYVLWLGTVIVYLHWCPTTDIMM